MPRTPIPIAERFWPKVSKGVAPPVHCVGLGDCWLWTGNTNGRYGTIGRGRAALGNVYAHRLSWELQNGFIPAGMNVCHHCDRPLCVNPAHLFIGDQAENLRDAGRKGLMSRNTSGANHPQLKFSPEFFETVRSEYRGGLSQPKIAKKYGMSQSHVSRIVRRATWA